MDHGANHGRASRHASSSRVQNVEAANDLPSSFRHLAVNSRPPPPGAIAVTLDPFTRLSHLFAQRPAILAPMEDVTDDVFRRLCRGTGRRSCVTEFVNVEGLLRGCRNARRKITLADDDELTAIQIYGSDPERLAEAARFAEAPSPLFLDINCGCWVPEDRRARRGRRLAARPRGDGRDGALVVSSVSLPVTVKTRIGYGPESHMPIVDLARRLEDAGRRGAHHPLPHGADGAHAARPTGAGRRGRARSCRMPVIVNGDIKSADDAERAIDETGCEGVMVGRRAIEHPWIFREARALLDRGETLAPPTPEERIALCREHLAPTSRERGEPFGVRVTRRHLSGYLRGLRGAAALRQPLVVCDSLDGCLADPRGGAAEGGVGRGIARRWAVLAV